MRRRSWGIVHQFRRRAFCAKGALETAYQSIGGFGRKVFIAALAIRPKVEHRVPPKSL
jgi:hypothetical protein